jgi:hypothetical protein
MEIFVYRKYSDHLAFTQRNIFINHPLVKQSTIHNRITVSLKTHILAPLPQKLFSSHKFSLSLSLSHNLEGSPKKVSTMAGKDQILRNLPKHPILKLKPQRIL